MTMISYRPVLHLAPSLEWECVGENLQAADVQYEWPAVKCQLSYSFDNPEVETSYSWEKGKVSLQKDTIVHQRNFNKKETMSELRHCCYVA